MKRNFNNWLSTFKESIADWTYYSDFRKVYKNVEEIKIPLNILNSLINSKNIENEFRSLVDKYPEVLKVIPILLAKRELEIKISNGDGDKVFNFKKPNYSIDEYVVFMKKTGLFDLLSNHIIGDLTDYVKGVEVGLDSNARKNRTGTSMENIVEAHLQNLGFKKDVDYFSQFSASRILRDYGIDVTNVDVKDKAEKRFDFVVKTQSSVFAIEVNFYSGGGSKLNETARSYKMIAQESNNISGFKFIWITDGVGWFTAKNPLSETFSVLDEIFNINDLEQGKLKEILN
jgi:type II restriction enzyme